MSDPETPPPAEPQPADSPSPAEPESAPAEPARSPGLPLWLQLFAVSFMALFLELMLIRWVPAAVRVVAYYANLMLISSFLGLGAGAMLYGRGWKLFRTFPILLLIEVGFLALIASGAAPGGGGMEEMRFYTERSAPAIVNYLVLVGVFAFNALTFVALGERIGELFRALPPLRAYSWDLVGSLIGSVSFGAFSLLFFSPLVGMALALAPFLLLATWRQRALAVPLFAVTLALMSQATAPHAVWSPYYYITVHASEDRDAPAVAEPVENLRTMRDPPTYNVRVNHDFYQAHGTLDPARYSPDVAPPVDHRDVVFKLRPGVERALVLGAGGGPDVESLLLAGAKHVDAVEIDPGLVRLAGRYNAGAVYQDPRVNVVIDDARAHLRRAESTYDVVMFGFLDSQALASSMASIRLDGFVYTVEGIRAGYDLVEDQGLLALAFNVSGHAWLAHKIVDMVREATGKTPIVYRADSSFLVCVPKGYAPRVIPGAGEFELILLAPGDVPPATDDWPYLYLADRGIPRDYLIVVGLLLVLSIGALSGLSGKAFVRRDAQFFFLGMGFLLLETRSIVDCSLYFGATWLTTNLVVGGVLLMVLAANLVAIRFPDLRLRWLYVGLFASLLLACFLPREWILGLPLGGRLAWTLLAVPLPVFFAGVIFSSSFRTSANPSATLGANLIGATVGGFTEYLGMATGHSGLAVLLLLAYAASAFFASKRAGAAPAS